MGGESLNVLCSAALQNALRWIQLGELWVGVLKSRIDLGSRMLYEVCGYGGNPQGKAGNASAEPSRHRELNELSNPDVNKAFFMTKTERERSLAVFIDLENLAMGFQNQRKIRFEVQKVLERLVEKGKLIVKKAYADWSRYPSYTAPFHESAIELIEIPKRSQTGKNSADIRLVVDAMDLAWSKPHVDTFVIVSGDSDFSPLVSKLKENGKHVIGLGMKGSTADLLRDNCDEFIYYEDLERQEQNEQQLATDLNTVLPPNLPERQRELYSLLIEACNGLRRENHEVLYASMIKDTMKRKKPSFDESYYGYRSFTHMLEDADNLGIVDIERNPKSGTYVVTSFSGERDRKSHRAGSGDPLSQGPNQSNSARRDRGIRTGRRH
jgi:uncharacterized protein (TIGR00288 family)